MYPAQSYVRASYPQNPAQPPDLVAVRYARRNVLGLHHFLAVTTFFASYNVIHPTKTAQPRYTVPKLIQCRTLTSIEKTSNDYGRMKFTQNVEFRGSIQLNL